MTIRRRINEVLYIIHEYLHDYAINTRVQTFSSYFYKMATGNRHFYTAVAVVYKHG